MMKNINIININNKTLSNDEFIYCGRGSPLGNKYHIDKNVNRDVVITLYKDWFYKNLKNKSVNDYLQKIIIQLELDGYVNLGCFCAPKKCHCEIIREYLINLSK